MSMMPQEFFDSNGYWQTTTDANLVRINELARELQVRAKEIVDLLPEFGVTEKSTHSSAISADVAQKVRKRILGVDSASAAIKAAPQPTPSSKQPCGRARMMPTVITHPRRLHGPWTDGFALDRYSGSVLGTLVQQLKYKKNAAALVPIVDTVENFIRNGWEGLPRIDCIVPAPPSVSRPGFQPAMEISGALAGRLDVYLSEDVVLKVKPTPPMKSIFSGAEKHQMLREAIQKGPGEAKNQCVLVVDDVTDTLATLGRVTDVLLKEGASDVYVLGVVHGY
jgi:predicted amidophosphoribosyltransferase